MEHRRSLPRRVLVLVLLLLASPCIVRAAAAAAAAATAPAAAPAEPLAASNNGTAAAPGQAPPPQPPPLPVIAMPTWHKNLVPLSANDAALLAIVAVAIFVASSAGVGGGVLMVPALLLVGGFSAEAAVALSNTTIFAASLANLAYNVPRRSPVRSVGPLIDWDLVLLFGPPTIAGSIAGSHINMVVPGWVTKSVLFLLFLPMAWRMGQKAASLYKIETAQRRAAGAAAAAASGGAPDAELGAGPLSPPPPQPPGRRLSSTLRARRARSLDRASETSLARSLARASALSDVFGPYFEYVGSSFGAGDEGSDGGKGGSLVDDGAAAAVGTDADAAALIDGKAPAVAAAAAALPPSSAAGGALPGCLRRLPWPDEARELPPAEAAAASEAAAARIRREEAAQLPPLQVGLLCLTLVVVVASSLIAGFLLACGSWQFWLMSLAPLLLMLLVELAARRHVLWKAAWKAAAAAAGGGSDGAALAPAGAPGAPPAAARAGSAGGGRNLKWTPRTTAVYPAVSVLAGVIAGLLGLGGGLVLAPMTLELGVHPAVSAASTQVTLLVSSATASAVYTATGAIPWDYGGLLAGVGLAATLLGQWAVTRLVARLGRPSVLVIVLAAMFAASGAVAAAVLALTALDIARHPEKLTEIRGACPARGA